MFFCEKRTVFSTVVNSDSLDIIHTHTHSIPTCLFFSINVFGFVFFSFLLSALICGCCFVSQAPPLLTQTEAHELNEADVPPEQVHCGIVLCSTRPQKGNSFSVSSFSISEDGADFTDIEELTFSLLSCSAAMLGGQGGVG